MSEFLKGIVNLLLEAKINLQIFAKTQKIYRNIKISQVNHNILQAYRIKWRQLGCFPSDKHYKIYASISGKQTEDFVPENIYYNKIEPCLNDKAYVIAYTDKNLFQRLLHEYSYIFPHVYLRCISGVFLNNEYTPISMQGTEILPDGEFIIKPASFTGGGKGVTIVNKIENIFSLKNRENYERVTVEELKKKYRNNFIVQEKITQHPWFAYFNKSSLNTIRILIYRSVKDNSIHILNSVLRFGAEGSIVDNQASGGFSTGIDKNGIINSFMVDKKGVRTSLNVGEIQKVPFFDEMKVLAVKIAPLFYYQRLLGFDFTVDADNNVKILEINCKNLEINFHQMNNGHLFGDLTDEIIAHCKNAVKTITFNFRIIK